MSQTDVQTTTVLVEGESDRLAVEALAHRSGHDLTRCGITVVEMGGATNIGRFLARYGPHGAGHRVLGLCDAGEEAIFARALDQAGLGTGPLPSRGFFVCHADLEEELLQCLGIDGVLKVIEDQGELASFRLLQRQPALREESIVAQLRRFFGGRGGNKIRYPPLLVAALPAGHAPPPLANLIAAFAP